MIQNTPRFDFEDTKTPDTEFELHEQIIEDRGSRYSVSYGKVSGREDIKVFLKKLKEKKKYAKATHNSWAARISMKDIFLKQKMMTVRQVLEW